MILKYNSTYDSIGLYTYFVFMKRAYSTESVNAVIIYTIRFRGNFSDFEKITFQCRQFFFITFFCSPPIPFLFHFSLASAAFYCSAAPPLPRPPGCLFFFSFWDALYTRNRDSERSMINATTRERRLQRRFDYGY